MQKMVRRVPFKEALWSMLHDTTAPAEVHIDVACWNWTSAGILRCGSEAGFGPC
jgi:hypothetical protein